MAQKRKKKRGGGRGRGIIGSVASIILVLALVIAVCRMLGIHDVQSLIGFARGTVNPVQTMSNKAVDKVNSKANCNVLKGDNCSTNPFGSSSSKDGASDDGTGPSQDSTPQQNGSAPSQPSGPLAAQLNTLQVAEADKSPYSRASYPHWITQNGSCDTRETILKNVGFDADPRTCGARSKPGFTYTEPYSGKKVINPSSLDIDHVIPLKYANGHGAGSWDTARRTQFANDMSQLIAVDAGANRQKGDSGPSQWMPANKNETCSYTTIWITTASRYGLSITASDKTALQKGLASCS